MTDKLTGDDLIRIANEDDLEVIVASLRAVNAPGPTGYWFAMLADEIERRAKLREEVQDDLIPEVEADPWGQS